MGELTPRLIRALNEHAAVVPPAPYLLHPLRRRDTKKRAAEIVAAEWPAMEAKLRAADEKRRRKAAAARRNARHQAQAKARSAER